MDKDRWSTVNRIFHAALEVDPGQRHSLVAMESNGDVDLQAEVELLLKADMDAGTFLESPLISAESLSSSSPLVPGEVLCGRFRIVREIAEGGMGHVFEAFDSELAVRVALKIILPEIASNPEAIARFRQEVRLARSITHPNICRTFDIEREIRSSNGERSELVFLTMEFLPGETLATRIKRDGPLPLSEALSIARQIAAALHAAHALGVIHRDMKPANVMLVASELSTHEALRAVITDFGLARLDPLFLVADPSTFTNIGHPVGTLAYMAPEQLEGAPVSPATDIYAFGLIIFEMVTGKRAFPANDLLNGVAQRLRGSPPLEQLLAPEVPARWLDALKMCLHVKPSDRPQEANDVMAILEGDRRRFLPRMRRSNIFSTGILSRVSVMFVTLLFSMALFVFGLRLYQTRADSIIRPGALVFLTQVKNQTGEKSFDTLTELIQAGLSQSMQINLLDQGRVGDILQQMTKSPEAEIDAGTAREIAMRAGAARIIFATVTGSHGRYTLNIDIQQPDNTPARYRDHWTKSFSWQMAGQASNSNIIPNALLTQVRSASDWIRHKAGESANDIARLDAPPEDVTTSSWPALADFAYAEKLESQRKREEAVSALRAALREDPNFALAYARLGDVLVNLGDVNEGYESYLKALDRNNVDRLSLRERNQIQGEYALDTHNFQVAEDAFREYSLLYENDYFGWFRRALPLLMLNRPEEAIGVLKRAHAVDPAAIGAIGMLVRVYLVMGNTTEARRWTGELRTRNGADRAAFADGAIHFLDGDYAAAIHSFQALTQTSSPLYRGLAFRWMADVAAEQGDYGTARELLTKGIAEQPESSRLWERAVAEGKLGNFPRCVEDLGLAIQKESSPDVLMQASGILGRLIPTASAAGAQQLTTLLFSLENKLPTNSYGLISQIARSRIRGEMLLAKRNTAGAVREFRKADSLDAPFASREYLGRALTILARQTGDSATAHNLREQALAAYEPIALHPGAVWQLPTEYPPGFYADQLEAWLRLAGTLGRSDEVQRNALHQYLTLRPKGPLGSYWDSPH